MENLVLDSGLNPAPGSPTIGTPRMNGSNLAFVGGSVIVAIIAVFVLLAPPTLVTALAASRLKRPQLKPITKRMTRLTLKFDLRKPFSQEGQPPLKRSSGACSTIHRWTAQQRPTGQHRREATQPMDKSSCNASEARIFSFGLLSAGFHLNCCEKPVVAPSVPRFNCTSNHFSALRPQSLSVELRKGQHLPPGLCS